MRTQATVALASFKFRRDSQSDSDSDSEPEPSCNSPLSVWEFSVHCQWQA